MSNTESMTLTSWELLQIYSIVGIQRGSLGELRKFWKLQDVLEPNVDEKEQLGWESTDTGYILNPDYFDVGIEVELSKRDIRTIKTLLEQFNAWPAGKQGKHRIVDLCDKFGIEAEE